MAQLDQSKILKKENKELKDRVTILKDLVKIGEEQVTKLKEETAILKAKLAISETQGKEITKTVVMNVPVTLDKIRLSQAILKGARIFLDVDVCDNIIKL